MNIMNRTFFFTSDFWDVIPSFGARPARLGVVSLLDFGLLAAFPPWMGASAGGKIHDLFYISFSLCFRLARSMVVSIAVIAHL